MKRMSGSYSDGDGGVGCSDDSDDDFPDVVHAADMASLKRPQCCRRHQDIPSIRVSSAPVDGYDGDGEFKENDDGMQAPGRRRAASDGQEEEEEEGIGVVIAMTLLVMGFLALVGYIGYQVVVSDASIAKRMPPRQ